ncbi:hypothetical protein B1H18_15745 [Streptomyces tsukubensis]|uniref:Uncharacterized protein n=1 Tax=Streptomyces tsukubensis TaxID=83656 RepID=A0A1V4A8D8_9ACTN|nr:hypothetical protein B1H18_15745 [Streptomyces tsukubensis]
MLLTGVTVLGVTVLGPGVFRPGMFGPEEFGPGVFGPEEFALLGSAGYARIRPILAVGLRNLLRGPASAAEPSLCLVQVHRSDPVRIAVPLHSAVRLGKGTPSWPLSSLSSRCRAPSHGERRSHMRI